MVLSKKPLFPSRTASLSEGSDLEALSPDGEQLPLSRTKPLMRSCAYGALAFVALGALALAFLAGVIVDNSLHEQEQVPTDNNSYHATPLRVADVAEKQIVDISTGPAEQHNAVAVGDPNHTHHAAPLSTAEEDADALRSAARDMQIAAELRQQESSGIKPLLWVSVAGHHHVVDDEGDQVTEGSELRSTLEGCKTACNSNDACKSFTYCDFGVCFFKSKHLVGSEKVHHNDVCTSYFQTADLYRPSKKALALPSSAVAHTYYVFRAQGPAGPNGDYPAANVNVASIGGAMWYLHDEVVKDCWYGGKPGQRRFGITRLRRFKITTKATQPLLDRGMNYGILSAFDSGESTGWQPGWHYGTGWNYLSEWDRYGYYVGCNNLGEWPHSEPVFQRAKRYPNAIWYSLPGSCPMMDFKHETTECKLNFPGGACRHPDGRGNCTYHIEEAGEIDIDELVGITPKWRNREEFCRQGGFEGDGATTAGGRKIHFWDNIWDPHRNQERVEKAIDMFNKKYPDMPKVEDLAPPRCDFTTKGYW